MPSSRRLIASNTLTGTAASVTFSSIPATFTDLVLKFSIRSSSASLTADAKITFNSITSGYSYTLLYSTSVPAAASVRDSSAASFGGYSVDGDTATANSFNNGEMYLPNYAGATNKPFSVISAPESNTSAMQNNFAAAGLLSNTAAISSIVLSPLSGNFLTGSSFFLYGLVNS